MSNQSITAQEQWATNFPDLANRGIDEPTWSALKNSVFYGAQDASIIMAVDYCRSRNLDVLLKPVHIVPMYVTDKQSGVKGYRDTIMPAIGMYRIQADRTGNYAGADAAVFGPTIKDTFTNKDGNEVSISYPEWCSMTVYKTMPSGDRVGFTAIEYWIENYATDSSKSNAPNSMWAKRPRAQLVKCVEAQCLRRGWPEIGQAVTAEEMEGSNAPKDITPTSEFSNQPAPAIESSTPNPFPDSIFQQRLQGWSERLNADEITVEQIVNFVESKDYQLTTIQHNQLVAIGAKA